MNDRLRLAGYGTIVVVLLALVGALTPYGAGTALMGAFLLSSFGLMFLAASSYDRPDGGPGSAPSASARGTVESPFSVPYADELFYVAAGASATSLVGVALFIVF